jgi:hypothetical protein
MPAKHRNKEAWQYLNRDHDVSGRHPAVPATADEDLSAPVRS